MACKSCSQKRRKRTQSVVLNSTQSVAETTFTQGDFQQMFYVGPPGVVASTLNQLSYGTKNTNDFMFVHKKDLESNPHLWKKEVEIDD